jgi:hypothetical protein
MPVVGRLGFVAGEASAVAVGSRPQSPAAGTGAVGVAVAHTAVPIAAHHTAQTAHVTQKQGIQDCNQPRYE